MTTANKIKNALKGKNLSFVNVEKVLNDLGYSIVLFNTASGDEEIKRYNLEDEATELKAFTYSETAKIVFINGALHSDDILYLALHELGHIILGHIGDGKLTTRNSILIDIEADNFVYSIIKEEKTATPFVILLSIVILLMSMFVSLKDKSTLIAVLSPAETIEVAQEVIPIESIEPDIQPGTIENVYVTSTGNKFHREGCRYLKGSILTELSRTDALKEYSPCKVCKP